MSKDYVEKAKEYLAESQMTTYCETATMLATKAAALATLEVAIQLRRIGDLLDDKFDHQF
jgi:hypothetical protein